MIESKMNILSNLHIINRCVHIIITHFIRSRFCKTNVFNRGHYSLFKAFKVKAEFDDNQVTATDLVSKVEGLGYVVQKSKVTEI